MKPASQAVLFSSASDLWATPPDLYAELHTEFGFKVDVAANEENHLCPHWFGPGGCDGKVPDALAVQWTLGPCWMNPPFSRVGEFVAKAAEEMAHGILTVALLPSRTDTRWWHAHVWDREHHHPKPGVQVRFLKGRLKFGGSKDSAPFPSVVVVFHG